MNDRAPADGLTIAFFTDTYRPALNGIVTVVDLFAEELRAQGHRVHLFGPAHPRLSDEPDFHGIRSVPLPVAPEFRIGWPMSRRGLHRLPEIGARVVHLHSPGPVGIMGLRYGRARGLPIVQTYHAMLTEYARHYVPRAVPRTERLVGWWQHFLYNRGAAITAPSPHIATYLQQIGIHLPITVLPAGLDIARLRDTDPDIADRYGIAREGPIVATLSRLAPEKNVGFLLRSFGLLREWCPSARMLVIGGGPDRKNLERLATRLRIQDAVTFTGMVPRVDAASLLGLADVFVYACRNDTQGMVVMEALATGRPIVLVRDPVFAHLVVDGENGYAVPQDEYLFAHRVRTVLEDRVLAARMGLRSGQVADRHAIADSTRQLVALYADVIAGAAAADHGDRRSA